MRRVIFVIVILFIFIPGDVFCMGNQIQHIDFLIENDTDGDFDGIVWFDADDIYSLIPDFDGFSFLATTTNSPDLNTDLKKFQAYNLPAQALDEDGDGVPERFGIYMSVGAHEKKVVTVHVGQIDRIIRLRPKNKKMCDASLMNNGMGVFWESDKVCYGYDTSRRVVKIFGKMTQRNLIDKITSPGYDLSALTFLGKEISIKSGAPGFGSLGILENGSVIDINRKKPLKINVNAVGPIAACVTITFPGNEVSVRARYVLPRNSRWTWVDADLSGSWRKKKIVVGIPERSGELTFRETGLIATLSDLPLLGLAVYVPDDYFAGIEEQDGYHLAVLKPDKMGHIRYAFAAYWELEHQQNIVEQGELDIRMPKTYYMDRYETTGWILMRPSRMDNQKKFHILLDEDVLWIKEGQPEIRLLSEKAVTYTELLPPEAVRENQEKSYEEALDLLINRLNLFAEEGLTKEGEEKFWVTSDIEGKPHFIKPNRSWGDGYWVSMLWDAYKVTGDNKFKEYALKSNRLMLGGEEKQGHATGLNYWNSSARSYKETGVKIWRDSAMKCADMFLRTALPVTGFVPGYKPTARKDQDDPYDERAGYYIDAMICIPILWWAYQETKDKKYLEAGIRHTDATKNTLTEPDGSVFQLAWYHPQTGEILGIGTTQGYAGNTTWARGHAWVLDGFPDAYKTTKKKEYLDVFRRSAEWLMQNMPEDFVPWYDYDDQGVFWRFRDTSAGAISAFGLMRISELETDPNLAKQYKEFAIKIVNSLIDNYLTPVGADDTRPVGMLSHQCYVKVNRGEQIWGSFNLMKALCWLKERGIQRK